MSKTMEDLSGKQFDYLLVIERGQPVKRKDGRYDSTFICRCKCGNIISVKGISLKKGNTTSCGCKRLESVGSINRTHSQSKNKTLWNLGENETKMLQPEHKVLQSLWCTRNSCL